MRSARFCLVVLAGLALAPAAAALPVDECADQPPAFVCVYLSPDGAVAASADVGGDPGYVSLYTQGDSSGVSGGASGHVHGPEISAGAGFGGDGVVAYVDSPETGCYYVDLSISEPPFVGTCPF